MVANDKCWFFLCSPAFIWGLWTCSRNPDESHPLLGLSTVWTLYTAQVNAAQPNTPTLHLLPPWELSGITNENGWRDASVKHGNPWLWDLKSHYRVHLYFQQVKANKRPHKGPWHMFSGKFCWNSWRHFLLCTLLSALLLCRRLLVAHIAEGWWMDI